MRGCGITLADFPARHFQYARSAHFVCASETGKGQREALSKHWSGPCLHVRLAWHKQTKIANTRTESERERKREEARGGDREGEIQKERRRDREGAAETGRAWER